MTGQAAALLLGRSTPDPIALAVANGPSQARLAHAADRAVGQSQPRLLFGGWEEDFRVEAIASRPFLPEVRWAHLLREALHVDLELKHLANRKWSAAQESRGDFFPLYAATFVPPGHEPTPRRERH